MNKYKDCVCVWLCVMFWGQHNTHRPLCFVCQWFCLCVLFVCVSASRIRIDFNENTPQEVSRWWLGGCAKGFGFQSSSTRQTQLGRLETPRCALRCNPFHRNPLPDDWIAILNGRHVCVCLCLFVLCAGAKKWTDPPSVCRPTWADSCSSLNFDF